MAEAPLRDNVKRDLYRLYNESRDYLPGLSLEAKIDTLENYQLRGLRHADRGL